MTEGSSYLGLDIGTSGARAVVIDGAGSVLSEGAAAMEDFGSDRRAPQIWWQAACAAIDAALAQTDASRIVALSVDGTSGTMLAVDEACHPLSPGIMYNDPCEDQEILSRIAAMAPRESAAHGSSSALARAIQLARRHPGARLAHQADWIASQLSGQISSDENNALKTGYDGVARCWPDWLDETGVARSCLPPVYPAGTSVVRVTPEAASRFGLRKETRVVAGTTDGCAAFLATGASEIGDACTSLGTTLVLKILSDKPIFSPEYGIYSHRILDKWLAGGSSNSGGGVLLTYFSPDDLKRLSAAIDPEGESHLDYYPLPRAGERFPIADPSFRSRVEPRPEDDSVFLAELLHGIAKIEKLGYDRLAELGGPKLATVRSVGGGAKNEVWTRIRERHLGVPMLKPINGDAAYGSALLAKHGVAG